MPDSNIGNLNLTVSANTAELARGLSEVEKQVDKTSQSAVKSASAAADAATKAADEARYIHGEFGEGTWTFYGGHDPEDYRHFVYDPPTDLALHPNSPGYRLILNNILFPAAKQQKRKT